ncbi:MAG: metallophosphoesterase family protein [Oscillospiraceae bacterium]|nr:metallophosphoesterase family protein [Oscillospiraceae bacterium]
MNTLNTRPPLRFRADGTFTVMQISDVQDCDGITPRTIALLEAALDQEKPDFIIFTGDQVKGYGMPLWFGTAEQKCKKIEKTLETLLSLLDRRGIPFTFTFGNHDHDAPMSGAEQIRIYHRHALCCAEDNPDVPGYANHTVEVLGSKDDAPALNFYLLDSHDSNGFGYKPLDPAQIEWYRRTRDDLIAKNGGKVVPSFLFQHIPVEEIIQLYKKVNRGTEGALEGFRTHKGSFYVLDDKKTAKGSFMGELPSAPDVNMGLFAAARERGDMVGMFFGHDHNNGFHGNVQGIDLGYAPSAGFTAYGPGRRRGVRVFRFKEDDIADYQTYVRTDEQLLSADAKLPWNVVLHDFTPSSFGAAKPLVMRSVRTVAVTTLAIVVLSVVFGHQKKRRATDN